MSIDRARFGYCHTQLRAAREAERYLGPIVSLAIEDRPRRNTVLLERSPNHARHERLGGGHARPRRPLVAGLVARGVLVRCASASRSRLTPSRVARAVCLWHEQHMPPSPRFRQRQFAPQIGQATMPSPAGRRVFHFRHVDTAPRRARRRRPGPRVATPSHRGQPSSQPRRAPSGAARRRATCRPL